MNKIFDELKLSGKLPSPSGVGMQILRLTQEEDNCLDEITKVVRSDPSLTGRILKVANAGSVGGSPAVTTLEEAVMRLGFQTLRDLVLGFSLLSSNPKLICRSFDYSAFWGGSLARAVAAQAIAGARCDGTASECYVCGLLCEIGRLALASVHPDGYDQVLRQPGTSDPETLVLAETREFGINHRELTEALLLDWGFPRTIANAAATYQTRQASEGRLAQSLRANLGLADKITGILGAKAEDLDAWAKGMVAEFAELEIEEAAIKPLLATVKANCDEWGALLSFRVTQAERTEAAPEAAAPMGSPTVSAILSKPAAKVLPKLVLMEADEKLAASFEAWLKPAGYQVLRAASARDALTQIVGAFPQIVVAHGRTGDAEALELCKALRSFEAGSMIFFVLVTTTSDPGKLIGAFDVGVDDYLKLPCSPGEGLVRLRAAQRVLQLRSKVVAQERTLRQQLSELAVANRQLHKAALTDELTQLPNRRYAEETMRDEWEVASVSDQEISLIVADIDHFKKVNDTFGHLVGDLVLASVARVFRKETRETDVACRLGGEEFLVILPGTSLEGALQCAERLRLSVAATDMELSDGKHHVTVSLGVASRRMGGAPLESIEAVLKAADDAAYESKRGGRNRVTSAAPTLIPALALESLTPAESVPA